VKKLLHLFGPKRPVTHPLASRETGDKSSDAQIVLWDEWEATGRWQGNFPPTPRAVGPRDYLKITK
jgi:hypothetical protein